MPSPTPLESGCTYHIFNRGINGENLFREERHYGYFLRLYAHHIQPVAETFAFCLMRNHFHIAIRVRDNLEAEMSRTLSPTSQAFASFFNAYTKAINKAFGRTGGLFENPFRRIKIQTDQYFMQVIAYIHHNPQKHGFVADFRDWKWSSYQAILSAQPSQIERAQVLAWFGGPNRFAAAHLNVNAGVALSEQDFD